MQVGRRGWGSDVTEYEVAGAFAEIYISAVQALFASLAIFFFFLEKWSQQG